MTEQDLRENPFRDEIMGYLLAHDYAVSQMSDYDYHYALDKKQLFAFVADTQTETWRNFTNYYGTQAESRFLELVDKFIAGKGLLAALRETFSDYPSGTSFHLAYFRPTNPAMTEGIALAAKNIFSVCREFAYEDKAGGNRVDLAIFLNGLPVVMLELKKQTAGQSAVGNGIIQFQQDRSAGEKVFGFNRRTLVYLTLDEFEAFVATDMKTFLPFNRGTEAGAGNPAVNGKHSTCYIWEEILDKPILLRILREFMFLDNEGKMIFPRYHQLRAVRKVEEDIAANGFGGRYLIWHSAGSGKTKTLTWVAERVKNMPGMNTVIVISDRTVINGQLAAELTTVDAGTGVVKEMKSAAELKTFLDNGGYIIITTLQKFRDIIKELHNYPERNYAFVIDEAHSSMAGKSFSKVSETLAGKSLEEAAALDEAYEEMEDGQNQLLGEAQYIKSTKNATYFAFTATPKSETMELFGTRTEAGKTYFDKYTMKQAIEEGFILNPLQCYTVYQEKYQVDKKRDDGKEYGKGQAEASLMHYVSTRPEVIERKTRIMLADFAERRINWLQGKAKAMIIVPSRLHAVYYKQAVDRYLAERKLPFKALVAFTGSIEVSGEKFTEESMNGDCQEKDLRLIIKNHDEIRIIIVADKLQTGFDESKLCVLYVDKKMKSAVKAVQTFSRINRPAPGKQTFICDFANKAEDIKGFFEKYYDGEIFIPNENETDPNILFAKRDALLQYNVFDLRDVERIHKLIEDEKSHSGEITAALAVIRAKILTKPQAEKDEILIALKKYSALFYYVATVYSRWDEELKKFASFADVLSNVCREWKVKERAFNPAQMISLAVYTVKKKMENISLLPKSAVFELPALGTYSSIFEKPVAGVDEIVRDFNAKYPEGTNEMENEIVALSSSSDMQNMFLNSSSGAAADEIERKIKNFVMEGILSPDPQKSEFYTELSNNAAAIQRIKQQAVSRIWGKIGYR